MTRELLLTVAGDVQTKSRRTRRRFHRALADTVAAALDRAGGIQTDPARWKVRHGQIVVPTSDRLAVEELSRAFGIQRVTVGEPIAWRDRSELVDVAAAAAAADVAGRSFAVRVERHGHHDWRSVDLQAEIGRVLLPGSAGVDLDDPEREVRLVVLDRDAWLVRDRRDGPGGLPPGVEGKVLTLFSGGYDSAVAAWKMMRRGCHSDLLHVRFGCAQADHAAALARTLWRRWGAGHDPILWVVDGEPLRTALLGSVRRPYRQVVLKRAMLAIARRVAARAGADALVTGDAVGQVSSQTLSNLRAIGTLDLPVLRPVVGDDKDDIVRRARELGLADTAARGREMCDLAGGRVVVAASHDAVSDQAAELPGDLVDRLAGSADPVPVAAWEPGMPMVGTPETVETPRREPALTGERR